MVKLSRNFTAGKMNKALDERLIPNGEYIDALNIRVNSSEGSEIGVVENAIGNERLSSLKYADTPLSFFATTIGAISDDSNSIIYWFVHDPNFPIGATGKLDMIVSYNAATGSTLYHVISIDDGGGENTTLNFSPDHFITGIDLIDDMLFFTDDYNQPRKINVTRAYARPSEEHIDQFTEDDILVIRQPPVSAPTIELISKEGERNYLSDRFISFAYRYKYKDGEYSATSQFTEPAFIPSTYVDLNSDTFLNDGMINKVNSVIINYNSGSNNVVGIDLLFKEHGTNTIKIIDRIDKRKSSISDDIPLTYEFDNSKIYTILEQDELLRLYDNVPLLAKAQTIMGNRLMYGNYLEGYDMVDHEDRPVLIEYAASLTDRKDVNNLLTALIDGEYKIYPTTTAIEHTSLYVDLSNLPLREGSVLIFNLNIEFDAWEPFGLTEQPDNFSVSFSYRLQRSYTSVSELVNSPEFINAVGTTSNIKPLYAASPFVTTSCDGDTWTDIFNCAVTDIVDDWGKQYSRQFGLSINNQPIAILTDSEDPDVVGFKIPAIRYAEDRGSLSSAYVHAFFNIASAEVYSISGTSSYVSSVETNASLHSNTGYEVGIIYMDDYNRATPVFLSKENSIYIPSERSKYNNAVRITIPHTQIAPYWAKRYKFAIKSDTDTYETIYSRHFYEETDPVSEISYAYLLLEGENARKIEVDDELVVKRDALLPVNDYKTVKVISKESKEASGIHPEGVYIKINAEGLSFTISEDNNIDQFISKSADQSDEYPVKNLVLVKIESDDYTPNIPKGAKFNFKINAKSESPGNTSYSGNYREYEKKFVSEIEVVASQDYNKFSDFWNGEHVDAIINSDNTQSTYTGQKIFFSFNNVVATSEPTLPEEEYQINAQIWENEDGDEVIKISGFPALGEFPGEQNQVSFFTFSYKLARSGDGIIILETMPSESQPDIFYEGSQVFEIGEDGNHLGNVQDQDIDGEVSAIVDLDFTNCYSFGNGAESYKIRDSLSGKPVVLGQRVVVSSDKEYKQIRRDVDIIYSGIYNDDTNVNKLNEFNQGLVNYKKLEDSFGSIQLLDGRKTDILVLQEGKISYVLAGKNLLSDAAAGSTISSIPEVLGTQIARIEEYGISTHPESFTKHGANRFFTDAENGAVLMLTGDSFQNEQLTVISDLGMRPFFRDLFNDAVKSPKIGGYDPYLDEYVLYSTISDEYDYIEYMNCGTSKSFKITDDNPLTIYIQYDKTVGNATINYDILDADYPINLNLEYYSQNISSGDVSVSGVLSFNKSNILTETAKLTISSTQGEALVKISPTCVKPSNVTVTEIVLSDYKSEGQYVHSGYRFSDGDYTSPLALFQTKLTDGISRWNTFVSGQGLGSIPTDFSNLRISSKSLSNDNFVFDPSHDNFKFLRTNTEYTQEELDTILSNADFSFLDPIEQNGAYYSNFFVPDSGDYMYIIWDYRELKGFDYSWSNFVCVEEKSYGYFFDWSDFVCVQEKNSGFEANWSDFVCAQEETLEGFDYFWGGFVCAQEFQSDFDATWSDFICTQEQTSGFAADWSDFVCVQEETSGFDATWSDFICAQEETSGFNADWSDFVCVQEQVALFSADWSDFVCVQDQESNVSVGDEYEGGTIYYILQPTDPGYESGKTKGFIYSNPGVTREFGCEGLSSTKTIATTGLGEGASNTNLINENCLSLQSAARYCTAYTVTDIEDSEITYDDWFLPSRDELQKLMDSGLTIPNDEYIWASNDSLPDATSYAVANILSRSGSSAQAVLKSTLCKVIPVRTFEIIN